MALATGSGWATIPAASALPLTCHLTVISRTMLTGKKVWLFNPRRQQWKRHFRWHGPILDGRTPAGRATISVLAINDPQAVEVREELIEEGVFPPEEAPRGS